MKKVFVFYFLSIFIWAEHKTANALVASHSPYLKQHAYNPVDWYPWGKEALKKAKAENKLIFLSIGYSTCHWCHVMEEESFVDIDVAKLLNDSFVSIKIDKEEYPQIDKKYQQLYMDVKGKRGGWPLSVFLSPDAEVFHLGTYIPKEEGYGSKGLINLLSFFTKLQKENKAFEKAIERHISKEENTRLKVKLSTNIADKVVIEISKQFDSVNGGFATRPKFPEASKLELLLDIYRYNGNEKALSMAEFTLKKMANAGIYDQIGGGFFRYTTDYAWNIPHFEKMLYTNAELIAVYVKMYEIHKNPLYKKVIDETIAQMAKNYMQKDVYFSASDADSDGEEGGYFIYEYEDIKSDLGSKGWKTKELEEVLAYLGIEEDGNIDGDLSHAHITSETVHARVEEFRTYLRALSAKRTFPFVDKKIITAWNAMMVKSLFVASRVDEKYLAIAEKRLDSLLRHMYVDGVLYHQTLLGKIPKQKALLEDYTFLVDALVHAHDRTYKQAYLFLAKKLTKEALEKFYRDKTWYLSDDGIKVKADFDDRYYTSALSVMLENLVRLSSLANELSYVEVVEETIKEHGAVLEKNPSFSPKLVHTFLRLKLGDIIIHAKKNKLLLAQFKLSSMQYPFILSVMQDSDEYLACKSTMCFANDKNITKLIEKIKKVIP